MSYWKQKDHDLAHARSSISLGHYDWAIIAAVSAAKNTVKALLVKLKVEPKPDQEVKALLKAVEAAGTFVPKMFTTSPGTSTISNTSIPSPNLGKPTKSPLHNPLHNPSVTMPPLN